MLPSSTGRTPEALDEAVEVADHPGLVAVHVGEDDAGLVGLVLEERPERAVELGVHQQHVLAVLDRGEHRGDGVLDRARHVEQHVDVRALATSIASSVTAGRPASRARARRALSTRAGSSKPAAS